MKKTKHNVTKVIFWAAVLLVYMINDAFAGTRVDLGYRRDAADWNMGGKGYNIDGTPNVLSELKWTDLEILEVKATLEEPLNKQLFVKSYLGYGWILQGKNQDSDWARDNRTSQFSQSNNKSNGDHVADASLGLGYYLDKRGRNSTALLGGYSWHLQKLKMTDGNQTLADPGDLGPFDGLNSTYKSKWWGPWAGLDVQRTISDKLHMFACFEYHWANYYGEGNWNLRKEFAHPKSMENNADGKGTIFTAGTEYKINAGWKLIFLVECADFSTDKGIYTQHSVHGTTDSGYLNEANWDSRKISLWAERKF